MDADQMQALNDLISFANDHAPDVFEGEEWEENYKDIMEAVAIAQTYLDGDQNEA